MRCRNTTLVVLTLCVLRTATAAHAQNSPARLPYHLVNGQIVVEATVGESASQPAILDTGVPRCLITEATASRLFLTTEASIDMPTLYGVVRVPTIAAQALRIGPMPLTEVAFAVCDLWKQLSSSPPKDAPTLWIGTSALQKLCVTIDPTTETITLSPSKAVIPRGAVVVPFDISDGRVWVDVKAEGSHKYRALVTTGATGTLLPASVVRALKLKPLLTMPTKHPGGKAGSVAVVQMSRVVIGGLDVPQVPALALLDGDFGGADPELGVIGTDILLDYRVTFDFPQHRIAFEYLDNGKDQSAPTSLPTQPTRVVIPGQMIINGPAGSR